MFLPSSMIVLKGRKEVLLQLKKVMFIFSILFISCLCFTTLVNAETLSENIEQTNDVVAENTKYYRLIINKNNSELMRQAGLGENSSVLVEITEEEFLNSSDADEPYSTSIENSTLKLTSRISKYTSDSYKYEAILEWKKIPSMRSYDIIGVGYYASVKQWGTVNLRQEYCTSDNYCGETQGYYQYTGANGSAAMFYLPSGSLKSLKQSMYAIVEKNTTLTIVEQLCKASYAHATKSVTYSQAKDFRVDSGGIILGDSIYYSYGTTANVETTWTGTWK